MSIDYAKILLDYQGNDGDNSVVYRRCHPGSISSPDLCYVYRRVDNNWSVCIPRRPIGNISLSPTTGFSTLGEAQEALDKELINSGYVIMTKERLAKLEVLL